MTRFAGKRALVTGAGSGIGAAVARLLEAEGAEVVATDLTGTAVHLEVRDEAQVAAVVHDLDVLVNVAGIGSTTNAPETPLDVWEDVFAVNARGTFLCCKHAIPSMVARGGGSIVNIASVAAMVGLRNRAAYCASKGAVLSFTRALAVDHVNDGIRVNAVCPGTVDSPWVRRLVEEAGGSLDELTARQPLGRLGTPEEIAEDGRLSRLRCRELRDWERLRDRRRTHGGLVPLSAIQDGRTGRAGTASYGRYRKRCLGAGFWPAITQRQSPPSPLARLSSLAAVECGLWLGARDPETRRHYWQGH
jgi:2-keto-3-deoxy-L-fuconate dehydrogenase